MAQLRHQARGADAVPGHVSDPEQHPAVGQREPVVPVASDVGVELGRQVSRRDVEPFELGELGMDEDLVKDIDRATLGRQALARRVQRLLLAPAGR